MSPPVEEVKQAAGGVGDAEPALRVPEVMQKALSNASEAGSPHGSAAPDEAAAKSRKAVRTGEKRLARETVSALDATQKEVQKERQNWCDDFGRRLSAAPAAPLARSDAEMRELRRESARVSLGQMDAMRAGAERRRADLDAMWGRVHVPVQSSLSPLSYWDEFGEAWGSNWELLEMQRFDRDGGDDDDDDDGY